MGTFTSVYLRDTDKFLHIPNIQNFKIISDNNDVYEGPVHWIKNPSIWLMFLSLKAHLVKFLNWIKSAMQLRNLEIQTF